VQVVGAERLASTLRAAAAAVVDLPAAQAAAADLIGAAARGRAPRRTGALSASIRGTSATSAAVVTAGVRYAAPVHWGVQARGMAPNPFIIEAATATEPTWSDGYRAEVDRILDRVKGA
jgi:phage gpG-like protein